MKGWGVRSRSPVGAGRSVYRALHAGEDPVGGGPTVPRDEVGDKGFDRGVLHPARGSP
jgi:hypothetical protein